ncbi:oligoribonuclease [Marisediminicola sp. LYQ134]|uniref:oligoribonuclease n=1 Tax=unclassified Marisediminicola TaxID=2618316 RepID=UPI0039830CB6
MTETTPSIERGDEYLVIYVGGPYDGQTDQRISTDGSWDTTVTAIAAVDGKETLENYDIVSATEVDGKVHATYRWDKADSEPAEDPEDRGGRQ